MARRFSCCSTVLATTRAIWPHRMIALHRCQRQPNPQRPIPARLNNHTGMLQKRILVRRGVARRGTRAPSALRRRRAVLLHTPGPPRHMLKVRKQMGVGHQSALSEQLLLLGLRQLVGAARSNKQQEKKQTHWPGHRGNPRQVPHAIQVFHEEFCAQRRCLVPPPTPPPVASPSTVPQASRKYRCAATVWLASPETPAEPAPHCSTTQDWPSAPRTAQENNDGRSTSTHIPHQLLPLRVLTQTIPTGLLIQVILQRHQIIKQTLKCALVHQRRYHDTAPINDDPHRVAVAVGAPK
ncbi:hypothetical protein TCDM_09062 [Trypanosoma cruzi Dm28c]|uniref:Uncharacterized protein n=1 Tax=Trypanosoma cruzi Dm28c TaxID=1416333 RepID=V5B6G0_TRYCR|nr:hypothetical protein TCDM_09062 [Trypanosoma cruzi Dm28c]